ncbi:MAG: hypothetical protein AAF846_24220 [Chloroflexota bacterium]
MQSQSILLVPLKSDKAQSVNETVDHIVVVLSGHRADEVVLPSALALARETNAQIILIRLHRSTAESYRSELVLAHQQSILSDSLSQAQSELKAIHNKLLKQYPKVHSYLHVGDNKTIALNSLIDNWGHPYIIFPEANKKLLYKIRALNIVPKMNTITFPAENEFYEVFHYAMQVKCWIKRLLNMLKSRTKIFAFIRG